MIPEWTIANDIQMEVSRIQEWILRRQQQYSELKPRKLPTDLGAAQPLPTVKGNMCYSFVLRLLYRNWKSQRGVSTETPTLLQICMWRPAHVIVRSNYTCVSSTRFSLNGSLLHWKGKYLRPIKGLRQSAGLRSYSLRHWAPLAHLAVLSLRPPSVLGTSRLSSVRGQSTACER